MSHESKPDVFVDDEDKEVNPKAYLKLLFLAEKWTRPEFPLKGRDLIEIGHEAGPELGNLLSELEDAWIESNFKLSRAKLLSRAAK